MAASPGGKTTQLSQIMQNKGIIVAVDNNAPRTQALKNNIERMGCKNILVYIKDANYISDFKIEFDKILLDAPCSGNFCTDKTWFDRRQTYDFIEMQREQQSIVKAAVNVLKKNGILVYSTCSLEPEENEQVVEFALNLGLELIPINFPMGDKGLTKSTEGCLRIWPKSGMQPFFVAKFRKL
jgi:16S rRNA C967 or C1407 C5-methylase (RsmB/RsmF family)